MRKLKIAVTGGIGSGKTALCRFFQSRGYKVFFSDAVAKDIMASDAGVKKKIIKHFGKEAYNGSGLNKEYLASKVFTDPEKTKLINSIVHPATTLAVQKMIEKEFETKNIAFVESALVYEAKIDKNFDYVILVTSPDEAKIERVTARDKVSADRVIERMNNQIPDDKKKQRADFVINNNSTLEELEKRGEFILRLIESISSGE